MSQQPCHKNIVGPKNPRGPRFLSLPVPGELWASPLTGILCFPAGHTQSKIKARNETMLRSVAADQTALENTFPHHCPTSYVHMCESAKSCLIWALAK